MYNNLYSEGKVFALWKIEGEGSTDSSGGCEVQYVITESIEEVPQPRFDGRVSFYRIDSVKLVACFRDFWRAPEVVESDENEVVENLKQIGLNLL